MPESLIAVDLDIHIERPFINENKRGTHRTDFLRQSPHEIDDDLIYCYETFDNVSIVTVASEVPNMIENDIAQLVDKYGLRDSPPLPHRATSSLQNF
ncbi:unnamed protein product [Rotaria sp. Silwood1]|nr:unnamed protein product [Rotaria sp. Silwood1]CAF4919490.1 unnamed protein product [Rotaria sp. Silwood1]